MAEPLGEPKRGNIGDHSEFLAFATIIADGFLELTDPTGEIHKGRLEIHEVSREAPGQRAKAKRGQLGELIRRAYYSDGGDIFVKTEAGGTPIRLCTRADVATLVSWLKAELVGWSSSKMKRNRKESLAGGAERAKDLHSVSANKLIHLLQASGLKAPATSKSDLYLTFKQPNGTMVTQGFSAKSLMGANSCLINHSGATLITYEIVNCTKEHANEIENQYVTECSDGDFGPFKSGLQAKLGPATIIPALAADGCVKVKFSSIPNGVFKENLMSIDTHFPEMLAEVLYQRFLTEKSTPAELVGLPACVAMMERIGHPPQRASKVLELRIKDLFKKYAQGMNTTEPWEDSAEVKGGWVLVVRDGRVTGYCFEADDEFRNYLFESTYFDTPDVKRVSKEKRQMGAYVGRAYVKDGRTFIDLSLIVKFRKRVVQGHDKNAVG
jgi:hypothetical protein